MGKNKRNILTDEEKARIDELSDAYARREIHTWIMNSSSVKGGAQKDKSKYTRKKKHKGKDDE